MTAKRFTIFGEWHKDNVIDEIRDNTGEFVTIGRCVDLLNENEQLKHQLSQQEMEYVTDCHRLAEENMQLQEELDYYKTKCGSLETALVQGRRAVDKEKEQRMFFVDMEKQRKMFR